MRIVSSEVDPHESTSGVRGRHTVLYPTSDAEVKEALVAVKELGRRGQRVANTESVDDTAVVNLCHYSGIEIDDDNYVTVCSGATTFDLAVKLTENNLFLPMDGNPDGTVLSNVRSTGTGFAPAFGLATFLRGSQGINKDNFEVVENALDESGGSPGEHIVTKMVFEAKTVEDVKDYRMTRLCFTYSPDVFRDVVGHVFFSTDEGVVEDKPDVSITVSSGAYGMPLFTVAIVSSGATDYVVEMRRSVDPEGALIVDAATLEDENEPIGVSSTGKEKVVMITGIVQAADIVQEVAQEGEGRRYLHEDHCTRYSGELVTDELDAYFSAVHRAVGSNPTPILPRVELISTLSWKAQDGISAVGACMSLYTPLPANQTRDEERLHNDFASAIHDRSPEEIPSRVGVSQEVAVGRVAELDVERRVDMFIPGFAGEVFREGKPGYAEKATQYATTSYPSENERMTPYVIGYPENTEDVVAFVEFAILMGKKVVVRSGGHQYCGLSSGGSDTMLLSMELLKDIKVDVLDSDVVIAHAGPGAHLTDLAAKFEKHDVTIPHGECPDVGIGGHVQTGGFGHLLRSFGLALDYVKSFEIVLAHPVVESRTITRPVLMAPDGEGSILNDRIFWGVMGGGPGSFGVITDIEFECIRDMDHPASCGYYGAYFYAKHVFRATMTVVQKRTEELHQLDVLPKDCDMMVSALSGSWYNPVRVPAILVEMVHGNCSGLPLSDDDPGVVRMKKEIQDIDDSMRKISLGPSVAFEPSSHKPLSEMSNAFVRNQGMTSDGREFRFPYVKRLSCTTKALSDDFIDKFVDLVDKAMWSPGVKLVF